MLPRRALHDPALALAPPEEQWLFQRLHDTYRGGEIRAIQGADLIGTLAVSVPCLGDRPRERIERALPGLQVRGLLVRKPVEVPEGAPAIEAYTLKHAPQPRARSARPSNGAGDGTSDAVVIAGVELPGARLVDAHVRKAFSKTMSEEHRHDPRRLDETPAGKEAWKAFVLDLWALHQRKYKPRRRSSDAPEAATPPDDVTPVTWPSAPPSTPAATSVATGGDTPGESAATADSERVGREKELESLSLSSGDPQKQTFLTPGAREAPGSTAVTVPVTESAITTTVTSPPPTLTPGFVWDVLNDPKKTGGRLSTSGKADRKRVYAIFVDEGVTREEVLALAELARKRKLTGFTPNVETGQQREVVTIQWALEKDAKFLHMWIGESRREVARQRELGLPANDSRTGAVAPAVPKSTGPPVDARPEVATSVVPDVVMSPVIAARAERLALAKKKTGT